MRMYFSKYIYLIACTLILVILGLYGFIHTDWPKIRSNIPITFTIESAEDTATISLYKTENNQCYVFLPSYVKLENVKIDMTSNSDVTIGNITIYDGISCEIFILGEEYLFRINNHADMTLTFCQSANVATMYINTATGSMDRVHNDKEYEEPSSMLLVTKDGKTSSFDANSHIKGRGNSTWNQEKKPYLLKLSSDESLLGMSPSNEWVLLANSFDASNIRNKLIHDFAGQTVLSWTPQCELVDLYLNGSYNGLYLLVERIETNAEQLGVDTSKGDFVCKVDLADRWDAMRHPFIGFSGREIELTLPKELTPKEEKYIHSKVAEMEKSILSAPETNELPYLDLDTWVCKYLIDEIFANGDADLTSSYFYYRDNTFYAGPIWDYDSSLGNSIRNENPRAFTAKNYRKAPYYDSDYYCALYENNLFYNRIREMYKNDFLPMLEKLLSKDIPILAKEIETASSMNYLRWDTMYEQSTSTVTTSEMIISYLDERIDFLSDAWLNNVNYCTVQIEKIPGGSYYNVAVKQGEYLDESYLNYNNVTWINADTGEIYDIDIPITEDISLIQQR